MPDYLAKIYITLKPAVSDPAGQTVLAALHRLGHQSAQDARIGKYLEIRITAQTPNSASQSINQMCRQLLANPVIENYRFDLEPTPTPAHPPETPSPSAPRNPHQPDKQSEPHPPQLPSDQ